MTKVLMLTTVHYKDDHRIYYKEALSLEKHGYEVEILAPKDTSIIKHVFNVGQIFTKAIFKKADIVHCHEPSSLLIACALKPFKRHKIIYDVHEFYPELVAFRLGIKPIGKIIVLIESAFEKIAAFFFVNGIISVNRDIRMKFNSYCTRHAIIENYTSVDKFKHSSYGNDIIYIGTLSRERGIIQLVKAFNRISKNNPDINLKIVGRFIENEYEIEVKNEAKTNDNITFIGHVSYNEVANHIINAKVGICVLEDIKRHADCIPSKLNEYLIASKPIIVTDIWNDYINETQAGLTVKYNDIDALVSRLQFIIDTPEEVERMGKNGYKYIINNKMTWEDKEKELIKFYSYIDR